MISRKRLCYVDEIPTSVIACPNVHDVEKINYLCHLLFPWVALDMSIVQDAGE